jgi:hypothetical protein
VIAVRVIGAIFKGLALLILGVVVIPLVAAFGAVSAVSATIAEPNYYLNLAEKHKIVSTSWDFAVKTISLQSADNPKEQADVAKVLKEALPVEWISAQVRTAILETKKALGGKGPFVVPLPIKEAKERLMTAAKKTLPPADIADFKQGMDKQIPDDFGRFDAAAMAQVRAIWRYRTLAVPVAAAVVSVLGLLVWLLSGHNRRATAPLGVMAFLGGAGLLAVTQLAYPELLKMAAGVVPVFPPEVQSHLPILPLDALFRDAVGGLAGAANLAGILTVAVGLILMVLPMVLRPARRA